MRRVLAVALTVLLGAVGTLGDIRAADEPIDTPSLPREAYLAILDQCATAWDPTDRNIYTTDGASLSDVDRATRTAFVAEWQIDAWPRWRWEADCLRAAGPQAAVGAVGATADPVEAAIPPPRAYAAILDGCTPAWDPADRNIYTTDGFSLNDVDRATRTAFVAEWQIDAWPRWRWEADCLGVDSRVSVEPPAAAAGAPPARSATLNPTPGTSVSATSLPIGEYRALLGACTPVWNPADRNIYTTDGFSLNDVDRATRTAFVTVWQIDAWPRWRWEADCLGVDFRVSVEPRTAAAGAQAARPATLNPTPATSFNPVSLPIGIYREILDTCAPAWNPSDRNIYTTDGFSLNDVDRATRTAFVTVWQLDAWPRWRWEVNCLQGVSTPAVNAPGPAAGSSARTVGTVQTTYDPLDPPNLPAEVYRAVLDYCAPAWDPTDRNVFTTDGFSLNDVDRATRTSFVNVWQLDAWPRWRWEVNCLRIAFTPADDSPGGAFGLPPGAAGSPAGSAGLPAGSAGGSVGSSAGLDESPPGAASPRSPQVPAQDPTTHPVYPLVVQAAVARGADDALARQIAIQVVTEERFVDFLNGTHEGVLYGEHDCTVRNDACPLVPEATQMDGELSSTTPSTARQSSGEGGGVSLARSGESGRFAGYHMPICRPNGDGTSTCHVNPDWPVLEYRNGEYFRCKSLSPQGWGVGCVRY